MNSKVNIRATIQHGHFTKGQVSRPVDSHFVERILEPTNQERGKHGLQPLTLNARLTVAAQAYSKALALRDQGVHAGADSRQVADRVTRTGYRWSVIGKNVAFGHDTPEQVVSAWMNCDQHSENILNPEFREIGIGYYFLRNDTSEVSAHHYWVQIFSTSEQSIGNCLAI